MKPKRIYTYGGKPARRNLTVADMRAAKGVRKLVQVTANTAEEAAAAAEAGMDLVIGNAINVEAVRQGGTRGPVSRRLTPRRSLSVRVPSGGEARSPRRQARGARRLRQGETAR